MTYTWASKQVVLRRAGPNDRDKIFAWRNDPWIVSLSADQRIVDEKEHTFWFNAILHDPSRLLFIVTQGNVDVGTLRVEKLDEQRAALTVYLMRSFTGRGLGKKAIVQGSREAFRTWRDLQSIHAIIRVENTASIAAFRKAGYVECPTAQRTQRRTGLVEMYLKRSVR